MEVSLVFIALFATFFGILYVYFTNRNKERMALIEKGADASLFNTGREGMKGSFNWSKFTLKIGMLSMGVAVGIIAAIILIESIAFRDEDVIYSSMIFFFGGLSLVLFYIIDRKNK